MARSLAVVVDQPVLVRLSFSKTSTAAATLGCSLWPLLLKQLL